MARSRGSRPAAASAGGGGGNALTGLASVLRQLPGAGALTPLLETFRRLADTAGKSGTSPLEAAAAPATAPLSKLARAADDAAGSLSKVKAPADQFAGFKFKPPDVPDLKAPGGGAGAAAGAGLGEALGGLAGVAGGAAAALTGLVFAAEHFAGLLNPEQARLFGEALKDAQAAVGVALLPVLQTATAVIRDAGELILPVAQQLQPVFARLAALTGDQLTAGMETLASAVTALVPLFDAAVTVQGALDALARPLIDLVRLFVDLLEPSIAVLAQEIEILVVPLKLLADMTSDAVRALRVFSEGLAAGFGFRIDLSGPLESLRDAADQTRAGFQGLLKSALLLAAALAKSIGPGDFGDRFIDGLLNAIEGPARASTRGLRPAEGAHQVDIVQFGKDVITAASLAGMGQQTKKTEDWLSDIKTELQGLRKDQPDLADKIISAFIKAIADLPGKVVEAGQQQAGQAAHDAENALPAFVRNRGPAVDVIRRALGL